MPDPESPAGELRRAAALLREMAVGPDREYFYRLSINECTGMLTPSAQRWALAMSPAVAEPLAVWLEHEADCLDEWASVNALMRGLGERSNPARDAALQFARRLLTRDTGKATP